MKSLRLTLGFLLSVVLMPFLVLVMLLMAGCEWLLKAVIGEE